MLAIELLCTPHLQKYIHFFPTRQSIANIRVQGSKQLTNYQSLPLEFDSRWFDVDCVGWNEIVVPLRTLRRHWQRQQIYASVVFLIGLGTGVLQIVPLFQSLCFLLEQPLDFFFFVVYFCFLVFIIMNTMYFFFFPFFINNINLIDYLQKKKKKLLEPSIHHPLNKS